MKSTIANGSFLHRVFSTRWITVDVAIGISSRASTGASLGIAHHTKQLATLAVVIAIHFSYKMKAYGLVYFRIGLVPTALQVTSNTLLVGLLGDFVEQGSPNALALLARQDCNDIQKVVPAGIRPDLLLSLGLASLPDVVALRQEMSTMDSISRCLGNYTITFRPPLPYHKFIATWDPHSLQDSNVCHNHSPQVGR